jgi:hypothetical protein
MDPDGDVADDETAPTNGSRVTRTPAGSRRDGDPPTSPSCGILIRTYRKDLLWLEWCLAAVQRFTRGFEPVVVVLPEADLPWLRRRPPLPAGVRLRCCPAFVDDYLGQQVTKLYADEYVEADFVAHLDADCILAEPTTPGDLIPKGRPRLVMRSYADLGRHSPWRRSTEEFLGWPVHDDYMQQPPFVYPRSMYGEVRAHAREVHGMDLATYVAARPPRGFSEFNVLGAFARARHPDRFEWLRATGRDAGSGRCRWYWSWEGIDAGTRRELTALVSPPVPS